MRCAPVLCLCLMLSVRAADPEADYLGGLAQLDAARWTDAAAAFERARAAEPDDVRFTLALGVAQLLSEQAARAVATLQRAHRLTGDRDPETRMWLAAAQCLAGDLERARMTGGFNQNNPRHKRVYDACNTYGLSVFQARNGVDRAQLDAWRREGLALFPAVARDFAAHARSTGGGRVAVGVLEEAAAHLAAGRLPEALRAVEQARASGHDDAHAGLLHGEILLRLDAPAAARAILTDTLVAAPDASAAYLARALAHARLGGASAARRDLEHARARPAADARLRLPAGAEERFHTAEAILRDLPREDAATLARELPGKAGSDWKAAVDLALRLHRAAGAARLRWDERHQDMVRAAVVPTLEKPGEAEAWAALADTLDRQRMFWSEAVEPRAEPRPWRTYRPEAEQARILDAADRALRIDPKHAGAMASRASVLVAAGNDGAAEPVLRRALGLRDEPKALDLLVGVLSRAAAAKQAEAERLRSPRVESTTETRSDGEYRVTRTYPPSAADLAEAARLETEARAHLAEAGALYERLFQATRGTPDETYHRARHAWWTGDGARAVSLLSAHVRPAGTGPRHHHQLLEWMARGDATALDLQFSDSANRFHTTAAGHLRIAFREIRRGAGRAAADALGRAQALDPADARVFAYAGVLADEEERAAEAAAQYRAALALEEARLRLHGRGLEGGTGPLEDRDWGLSASVGLRLALVLARSGREADGLDTLRALSRGLAGRVNLPDASVTRREAMQIPSAQLPTRHGDVTAVPPAPEGRALLAWLHVAAGDALRRAGRAREAGEACVAALALNRGDEVRPLASYNRDERNTLAAARDRIPVEILTRFDMAVTLAEQGAIEAGAIKSRKQIHQEQMAARDQTHAAEGVMTQEYLRRSSELTREMAQRQRSVDRFDRAGQQALREEFQRRREELEAWRDAEMRRLHGPGYR